MKIRKETFFKKVINRLRGIEPIYLEELKECTFKDIKVGEVFGMEGCFNILVKISNDKSTEIANDWDIYDHEVIHYDSDSNSFDNTFYMYEYKPDAKCYKFPKSIQKMFASNNDTWM